MELGSLFGKGRGFRSNRLGFAMRRRAARRGEAYIADYSFPPHIARRVRRHYPELDDAGWKTVERGLREWFVCCAWRGRTVLGMPSRLVDDAWHEFILDSVSYMAFCNGAFDGYLHHTPDEAVPTLTAGSLTRTVQAWDRSDAGKNGESVLWDLDEQLGIEEPLGVSGVQLAAIRSSDAYQGGALVAPCWVGDFGGADGGGVEGVGGCGGGGAGDGGGGGCGGGGGGCGGGGS